MLRSALLHEIAGTGRRALCLTSLLVALCPLGNLAAQPNSEPQWPALERPETVSEADPFEQEQSGSVSDAAPQYFPQKIINSLRNSVGSMTGNAGDSLPAPESIPLPNEQKVIPMTPSGDGGNVRVEDHQGLISLTVRDASLRQVIALIAETQNLNLVFATPAETRITASFDRVPWRQVFDALLSSSGHAWTTQDGVIMITSVENAKLLPPGASGRHVEVFNLDFASAVDVDQAVKGMLSPAGMSWIMETSSDDNRRTREVVAVLDYPGNVQQIAAYICMADQPPRQVLVEAHILQIDLESDCRSGVNWDALDISGSGNEFDLRTVGFANPASTTAFFLEATGGAVETLVELLQTTTDAKTLASPKVLVVSGQTARMQVGEQLGFRVVTTTQTSTLEEVQFLDVGVVLTVTPRVTRDGRVLMRIKPEVSTGQVSADTGLPSEETTEVETDIMLSDGQGMVIGGLIQEADTNTQSKIPWLGDLPYVGILFQRRQVVKTRSEIVVTLVPHIQPYTPIVDARENHQLMQTLEPLVVGPLDRFYRPYEAQLPDTFNNPRRPLMGLLQPLPAVDQPATCYPTIESQIPQPVEQAVEQTHYLEPVRR